MGIELFHAPSGSDAAGFRPVSILLAESGTNWSSWDRSWSGWIVKLVQREGEVAGDFARRVARRVERLALEHVVVERLALVMRDDCDPAMRAARSEILGLIALRLVRSSSPLNLSLAGLDA